MVFYYFLTFSIFSYLPYKHSIYLYLFCILFIIIPLFWGSRSFFLTLFTVTYFLFHFVMFCYPLTYSLRFAVSGTHTIFGWCWSVLRRFGFASGRCLDTCLAPVYVYFLTWDFLDSLSSNGKPVWGQACWYELSGEGFFADPLSWARQMTHHHFLWLLAGCLPSLT